MIRLRLNIDAHDIKVFEQIIKFNQVETNYLGRLIDLNDLIRN